MFDQVFHYKWFADELESGPLSPHLDDFAKLLFDRGHARRPVRHKFVVLGRLSKWLRRHDLELKYLTEETLEKFSMSEEKRVYSMSERGDKATLRLFLTMLRDKGTIAKAVKPDSIKDRILQEFAMYLSSERGMTEKAICTYGRYIRLFIDDRFGAGSVDWSAIHGADIHRFISRLTKKFSPGTTGLVITALRSFFRFLNVYGHVKTEFSKYIPSVPNWRATNLPYYLSSKEVDRLLNKINRDSDVGKRDYAILKLLTRLGLRACEVANLSLDDINWSGAEITIHGKGLRKKRLPIPSDVGQALALYLKIRRKRDTRRVFLRTFPPYEGISSPLIGALVRAAITRTGLTPYKSGSHLLRHTAATNMLRRGASLTEIGMVLGHMDVNSTAIYAKVDLATLRPLVRPWPRSTSAGGQR